MNSSSEEDEQASSYFIRFFLLSLALFACNETAKEKIIVITNTAPLVSKEVEPPKTEKPAVRKKKKKIYLTFDDGPNRGTRNVLNIVRQEQVPVSFFVRVNMLMRVSHNK